MNNRLEQFLGFHLPENPLIYNALEDRIITEKNNVYYNFFNLSLRWLCGYNNQKLNNLIIKEINIIKNNPDQKEILIQELKSTLLKNSGSEFSEVIFYKENPFNITELNSGKKVLFLSKQFNQLSKYNLLDEIRELPIKKNSETTQEGWSLNNIKSYLKVNKNKISFLVLTPLILDEGKFLSNATAEILEKLCKKFKIGIIWDESLTCLYRSSTFFLLNQYSIKPDLIIIDANIYQNKNLSLIIYSKKYLKKNSILDINVFEEKNISKLVILHSLLLYISANTINEHIHNISYRLKHKLQALASNVKNRYTVSNFGLITIITINSEIYSEKLFNFLFDNNLLIFINKNYLILLPQLILSSRAVDLLVQNLDTFFKKGMNIFNN